ncbi:MAG TPA: S8 family serine peptidase, partial [Pyrinomonadaceae bacterium]
MLLSVTCFPNLITTTSSAQINVNGTVDSLLGLNLNQLEKVSSKLLDPIVQTSGSKVEVILQLKQSPSDQLIALLERKGIIIKAQYTDLNVIAVEIPLNLIEELANYNEVKFISKDGMISSTGHLTATTGTDAIRSLPPVSGSGSSQKVDGTGVGIAILDSGIYTSHNSFNEALVSPRTVYSKDFTGEGTTADPYGHGSHVASTAAGNDKLSGQSGTYAGVATKATLVNLRVLNGRGEGKVSSVLAAIDWIIKNGSRYKIRVVNMSFGTPAVDSYKNDPLCKAVRRLVDAGFVVVVAAGNDGKTSTSQYGENQKTYGLIHSPGNEPSAITVGASNTFGTNTRADDGIASYSSRGPTRSFYQDASGQKHYDNLIKPDLVAPGNKIIHAESAKNYLV